MEQSAYDLGYSLGQGVADLILRPLDGSGGAIVALCVVALLWLVLRPKARPR